MHGERVCNESECAMSDGDTDSQPSGAGGSSRTNARYYPPTVDAVGASMAAGDFEASEDEDCASISESEGTWDDPGPSFMLQDSAWPMRVRQEP